MTMTLVRLATATISRRHPPRYRSSSLVSISRRSLSSADTATNVHSSARSSANGAQPILLVAAAASLAAAAALAPEKPEPALCHCQVPCGIFNDDVRFTLVREHASTIRKASAQIRHIASSSSPSGEQFGAQSFNQGARWVSVKEQAAGDIITIVADYFLCQRVKKANYASADEYLRALEAHHALMQAAMKCKQTIDPAASDALDKAAQNMAATYAK